MKDLEKKKSKKQIKYLKKAALSGIMEERVRNSGSLR